MDDLNLKFIGKHTEIMKAVYDRLNNVHGKPLHSAQVQLAKDYFVRGMRITMSQWGRSGGKALAIDTPILTTKGWRCMADIEPGDFVFGPDGLPALVTTVSPIMYGHKCYDVVFSDGSVIRADAEHLWLTKTKLTRRSNKKNKGKLLRRSPLKTAEISTTEQIKDSLTWGKEANHSVELTKPLVFPEATLPIDPYVLGVWLGDGNSRCAAFYTEDTFIAEELSRRGYPTVKNAEPFRHSIRNLQTELGSLNLIANKHIPEQYLFASPAQRMDLLRGLLDTDGYCDSRGRVEFCNTNKRLAEDTKYLAESLGMKVTITSKTPRCQTGFGQRAYLVHIVTMDDVFLLPRKRERLRSKKIRSMLHRFIWEVRECESVPVKCIGVANESHLYLAGKTLIPTHNTESALFIATVASLLTPNFITYIITPERKQGKEIYWASGRLPNYAPPQYVSATKDTDLRVVFNNGSFICVDGCENYNAHRGLKPNLVIYDEFQQHSKEFHLEVMAPNLLAKQSSLLVYGTPPKARSAYYVEFRDQLLKQINEGDCTRSYYEFPTQVNPTIDLAELAKVRKELIESGNEVIWYREYEGKMAFGGEDIVFPKWNPRIHVRTHAVAMSYLEHDKHKLKWFTICDPGSSTCFAVLFAAYNPYTQQMFLLDEIYEKDRKRTDTRSMWERIRKKEEDLYPGSGERTWRRVYDEAAAWFANEVNANYHVGLIPTQKGANSRSADSEKDISRIKMLMAHPNALIVSDRCYWMRWEIESYVTDEEGNYPDRNDHLVDCLKYLMQISCWKLIEKVDNESVPTSMVKQLPQSIDAEDWADTAVEKSLWIEPNDIYSEYFH